MDKQKAASDILDKAMSIIPFEGWNEKSLKQAAVKAGYSADDVIRVFPGGVMQSIEHFSRSADARMEAKLDAPALKAMKIRQRIAALVKLRISEHEGHAEAVRKAIAVQALPPYTVAGLKNLYATVDAIWYAAGDTSTDFNFYTKRLLLAGVYSSTLLHWLDDKSDDQQESWEFLDRRIADVMRIENAKQKVKGWIFSPESLLRKRP